MSKPRVVIALGGNALQRNGEVTAEAQKAVASQVGAVIAKLSDKYEIVVAHGNGPQVGNILIHEETAATATAPAMPLETAVAMSQGQIGYWLAQAINNAFAKEKRRKQVVSVVTQVVVDRKDPAFRHPSKPIGEFYTAAEAVKLAKSRGWEMRVIDKDLAAAKLADLIKADIFVSVTAVPNAYLNYGQPDQVALGLLTPAEATAHIAAGHFAPGSMLPKIQAITEFAKKRRLGIITSPDNLELALKRRAGTIVQG